MLLKTIAYTTGVTTSGTPGTAGAHTTLAVTDKLQVHYIINVLLMGIWVTMLLSLLLLI